jgi:hypothetical protein
LIRSIVSILIAGIGDHFSIWKAAGASSHVTAAFTA